MSETPLIDSLPPVVAAGVAARAALSLHHTRKTTTATKVEHEEFMRAELIDAVRHHHSLGDGNDESTLEKIAVALYEISDHYLHRIEEVVGGLFMLDQDLKDNQLIQRRIRRESKVIDKTITYPTKQYQVFLSQKSGTITYQCVYVREFEGENPHYEFVVAWRRGRQVHVTQVVRMYPNVNARITLPDAQINLLLKTMRDTLTADIVAEVLQAQFPDSTLIVMYSSHWIFSYFSGGETNPLRNLGVILGDGYLDGYAKAGPATN
jgi:hypothetical protein